MTGSPRRPVVRRCGIGRADAYTQLTVGHNQCTISPPASDDPNAAALQPYQAPHRQREPQLQQSLLIYHNALAPIERGGSTHAWRSRFRHERCIRHSGVQARPRMRPLCSKGR